MAKLSTPIFDATFSNNIIEWATVTNAETYIIYVNNEAVSRDLTTSLTYDLSNLPGDLSSGDTIKVSAYNENYEESDKAEVVYANILSAPTGVSITNLTLSWSAVDGANSYQVYVNDSKYVSLAGTSNVFDSLTDEDKLEVSAKNSVFVVEGSKSDPVYYNYPIPSAPSISLSGLTVSWSAVARASQYLIYVNGSLVDTISGTSKEFSSLVSGSTIKVKSEDKFGRFSGFSNTETYTSDPEAPDAPSISFSGLKVSWASIAEAVKYDIYKNGTYVTDTTSTSYTFASLNIGDKIKVKSVDGDDLESSFSNELTYSLVENIIIRRRIIN